MEAAPWAAALLARATRRERARLSDLATDPALRPPLGGGPPEDLPIEVLLERLPEAWRAAAPATPGFEGEAGRRELRAIAPAALESVSEPFDRRIEEALGRESAPDPDFRAALAGRRAAGPASEMLRRWERFEARIEPLRRERHEARTTLARRVGASGVTALLAAREAAPVRDVLEAITRGAIEPADAAVATRARARRARLGPSPGGAWEDPALTELADHGARLPAAEPASWLHRLASGLGLGTERGGPRIVGIRGRGARAFDHAADGGAVGIPTDVAGPVALVRALGAFGRAARASFLARTRGALPTLLADPAMVQAAEWLFRRLALSQAFWAAGGVEPGGGGWLDDLRFEEGLAVRREWAFLHLACENGVGRSDYVREILARAAGRPAPPDLVARSWDADPGGASALRGAILAGLLEERLMTLHGRRWFAEPRSGHRLREFWEADVDETAEGMARAAGLGTIEPTPLLDLYGP